MKEVKNILIGNDVVDLNHTDCRDVFARERFLHRVFTVEELAQINESANPVTALWLYWAAKESAYKALSGAYRDIHFSWQSYHVDQIDNVVRFQDHVLNVHSLVHPDGHVHVVCAAIDSNGKHAASLDPGMIEKIHELYSRVELKESAKALSNHENLISPDIDSILVRELTLRFAGDIYSDLHDFTFFESEGRGSGVGPSIVEKKQGLRIPVSLSHHGRFLAVALSPITKIKEV